MKKIELTSTQLAYIRKYYNTSTHRQLFNALNLDRVCAYTTFRTALYKNGLKRFDPLRFTTQEEQCLRNNLNTMGNKELAAHISDTCGRLIKHKQIDKKLTILGLTRSLQGLNFIKEKNRKNGVYKQANLKRWQDNRAIDGDTRIWKGRKFIKNNDVFIPAAPFYWINKNGPIPDSHVVWHKDGNPANSDASCANLELITRQEAHRRVVNEINNRPESLKKAIKLNNKLSKILKNEKSKQS